MKLSEAMKNKRDAIAWALQFSTDGRTHEERERDRIAEIAAKSLQPFSPSTVSVWGDARTQWRRNFSHVRLNARYGLI